MTYEELTALAVNTQKKIDHLDTQIKELLGQKAQHMREFRGALNKRATLEIKAKVKL